MLSDILYYCVYASAVLIYGIGLDRTLCVSKKPSSVFIPCLKMLICVSATSALDFLIENYMLVPARLTELYPFFAVIIFTLIAVFVEAIIRITTKTDMAEFSVSLLCVLLGLCEGGTIASCVIISCLAVVVYFIFIPILHAIRQRIDLSPVSVDCKNESVIFISMAIIMIVLLAWNVSWLNPEAFRW